MARFRRQQSRIGMYAAIAFIVIMVLSVVGLFWTEDPATKVKFEEFTFEYTSKGWMTKIDGQNRFFEFTPKDTDSVQVPIALVGTLNSGPLLAMTSVYNDSFQGEIATTYVALTDTLSKKGIYTAIAFTEPVFENIPVLGCENASVTMPILFIKEGATPKFTEQNNCFIYEVPTSFDVQLLKTRLLFESLGIHVVK